MTDEKPEPGQKVGDITIPDILLRDMTEEERNELLKGGGLADDIKVFKSPIDGQLSVVAFYRGEEVCQYCLKRFREDQPELQATEIYTKTDEGEYGGTRIKVHGHCHDKAGGVGG